MSRNRLPRVMKHYSTTGRRNHGRSLKRLLDAWDRNGSTSGPIPWKIDDDDDDDINKYIYIYINIKAQRLFNTKPFNYVGNNTSTNVYPFLQKHASLFTIKLKLISKIICQLKSGFKILQCNSFRIQGQIHTNTNKQTHALSRCWLP